MTVESVAVLLPLLLSSAVVLTATLLIFGEVAFAATDTVTVMGG